MLKFSTIGLESRQSVYTRSKIVICACITIHIIYVIELNAIKFYFVINNKNNKRTTQLELDFI